MHLEKCLSILAAIKATKCLILRFSKCLIDEKIKSQKRLELDYKAVLVMLWNFFCTRQNDLD